jgi:hypothetical protein
MSITVVAVSQATAHKVRSHLVNCEHCSEEAEIPLSWLLDEVTGRKGSGTDYVLAEPLKCPRCFREITEDTPVEWEEWAGKRSRSVRE